MIVKKFVFKERPRMLLALATITLVGSGLALFDAASAGLEELPLGARSIAMGGTFVALANSADAVFLNPAGLGQLRGTHVALFYQKPFGLADLNFGTVALTFPVKNHRFGLGILHFGNSLYKEQVFTLVYSHSYQQTLYYGVGLSFQTVHIEGYGSSGTLGLDLGFLVPLSPQVNLGFFAKNLNRPSLGQADEKLSQSFKTGMSVRPTTKFLMSFEIFKDVRYPEEGRFGAEILPVENLAIRVGATTNPNRFSSGFGVDVSQFSVDYAFFSHNDLGLTHQISLSIRFGGKPAPGAIQGNN